MVAGSGNGNGKWQMGRSEKATDKVEKHAQRTSILHNGESNGLKDFSNSHLLPNEMLLCGYV